MAHVATRAVHRRARPAEPNQPGVAAGREVALQAVTGRARLEIRQAVGVAMLRLAEVVDELFVEGRTRAPPVRLKYFSGNSPQHSASLRARSLNPKSSPSSRGIHTAARSAVRPRDWSDINGSGHGTTGTVV